MQEPFDPSSQGGRSHRVTPFRKGKLKREGTAQTEWSKYVLKKTWAFERIRNPEIVMNTFESLDSRDLRMICFDGLRITVLLKDQSEIVFEYPNREQMEAAIEYWANPQKRFLVETMPE